MSLQAPTASKLQAMNASGFQARGTGGADNLLFLVIAKTVSRLYTSCIWSVNCRALSHCGHSRGGHPALFANQGQMLFHSFGPPVQCDDGTTTKTQQRHRIVVYGSGYTYRRYDEDLVRYQAAAAAANKNHLIEAFTWVNTEIEPGEPALPLTTIPGDGDGPPAGLVGVGSIFARFEEVVGHDPAWAGTLGLAGIGSGQPAFDPIRAELHNPSAGPGGLRWIDLDFVNTQVAARVAAGYPNATVSHGVTGLDSTQESYKEGIPPQDVAFPAFLRHAADWLEFVL